ncbi:MAG: acetyl-CoA decarbonylase/synthase complex subunit delta [Deltaproteobacteria bacterium]|nr:MAG: acetyl-CoA decarbonylase/synthase complex subunit delta [Deltaproteobacteria bacterium]
MMEYKAPIESYPGVVREVTIGKGNKAIKLGGENILPLHFFDEGSRPNAPKFALELWDMKPEDWPEWGIEPFKDVISDPVAWGKKCESYGADAVCLRLVSTDPSVKDSPPEQAAEIAKKVAEAINVPLIVYGSADADKDAQVLPKVASSCSGMNLLLGPVLKENYEVVAKVALDHGHTLIAQTPVDINLLKELNVRLSKFCPLDRVVIDPLSSALGYGFEYTFSLMERVKQAGVIFKDEMTQMPIIADLGTECWKTREAKESKEQALIWEGVTALSFLLAGANVLVLRHPDTLNLIREITGGNGK